MDTPDFADISWTPGAETKEALVAAAMAHLDAVGSAAFLLPVPGTDPPIYLAMGTLPGVRFAVAAEPEQVKPLD
jgi:hypothetical protein